jgi:SAM-dependent methyltransferase
MSEVEEFLNRFEAAGKANHFIKLTLSARRNQNNELKNVFVKPVTLKAGARWNFVYRYPTKDITKNYDLNESLGLLSAMITRDFYKADLFTTTSHFNLSFNKNDKPFLSELQTPLKPVPDKSHNRVKNRQVTAKNNTYLYELGVTTTDGTVKSDKQDKYRQINKYVEIIDGILKATSLSEGFKVADMGSGKGYLTFALYEHLTKITGLEPGMIGIEMRPELVDTCNNIAAKAGFAHLRFQVGSIETTELNGVDMLIALHACDIATDHAIYRGIKEGAKIIICAPCCHKQIRRQLDPQNELKAVTDFGILKERQAEIITDTIRALVLRAFGYKTNVFEFISTEHTPKNLLIAGVKTGRNEKINTEILSQIKSIKKIYNIQYHELEKLLGL